MDRLPLPHAFPALPPTEQVAPRWPEQRYPGQTVARFLPVAGTHGWRGQPSGCWWQGGSPWLRYMAAAGFAPYSADRPFLWSTNVEGHQLWRRLFGRRSGRLEWETAGENLYAYLVPPIFGGYANGVAVGGADTRIVAHSHGGQVALYAAARGLRIDVLVTVCSPVRADMVRVIEQARPNIRRWLHIYTDATDWWQILGGLGDGHIGIQRQQEAADENVFVEGAGHTGVLEDPDWFDAWRAEGWLDVLRGGDRA